MLQQTQSQMQVLQVLQVLQSELQLLRSQLQHRTQGQSTRPQLLQLLQRLRLLQTQLQHQWYEQEATLSRTDVACN